MNAPALDVVVDRVLNDSLMADCAVPHHFLFWRGVDHVRHRPRLYRCTKCGGIATGTSAFWYRRGLADAARDREATGR